MEWRDLLSSPAPEAESGRRTPVWQDHRGRLSCCLHVRIHMGPVHKRGTNSRGTYQTEPQIQTRINRTHLLKPQTEPNSKLLFLKLRTEPQFQKHQENSLSETLLQERCLKSFFSVRMLFLILLAKIAESVIQTIT